jgi:predicted translin family RNA/ssDNA-binding protein
VAYLREKSQQRETGMKVDQEVVTTAITASRSAAHGRDAEAAEATTEGTDGAPERNEA